MPADHVNRDCQVLIAGAGPTELVLALWLAKLGVRVRLVDTTAEPGTTSRALAVQGRTLEFYRQIGLADAVESHGRKVLAVNLWVTGKRRARAVLGELGRGISPYSYALIYPQDEHERLLIDHLAGLGVVVERQAELITFDTAGGRMQARLRHAGGAEEVCECSYIAGCDGAHSTVREKLGIGFPGGTYQHLFYVADVEAGGRAMDGELHVGLDRTDFLALFPLKAEGRARLVGAIHDDARLHGETLSWNDVQKRVVGWLGLDVRRVNWFSTYRVHHRVANAFREDRVFLIGDAAHIHSPVGGQGMNTGIGDAVNLAWKLAAVVKGNAPASLLDTYEPERIAFARRLVATTDRGFIGVTSSSALARLFRLRVVPVVLPLLFRSATVRRLLFRTVSQTAINYRDSALSEGEAGGVRGGDRLPWVAGVNGADNYAPLRSLGWQVHVYGEARDEMREICANLKLPLHAFPWQPAMERAGLWRNASYLIRPDGHVALASAQARVDALTAYLERQGLKFAASA